MKNSILNLGKVLNKAEQKEVNGGIDIAGPCVCASNKTIIVSCSSICSDGTLPYLALT